MILTPKASSPIPDRPLPPGEHLKTKICPPVKNKEYFVPVAPISKI